MKIKNIIITLAVLSLPILCQIKNPVSGNLSPKVIMQNIRVFEQQLKRRFSYFKTGDIDFTHALKIVYEQAQKGMTKDELAIELTKIIALFIDGHARVRDFNYPTGYLPFLIESSGNKYVSFFPDRSSFLDRNHPYITKIDGKNIDEWCKAANAFIAKGSPQYIKRQALRLLRNIQFLRDELGIKRRRTVTVELSSKNASQTKTMELQVTENLPEYDKWPLKESCVLDGNYGYLRITAMNDEAVELIEEWMPKFRNTRGLIVDVRDNGGGSRKALRALFPHFMNDSDKPKVTNAAVYRLFRDFKKDHLENRFMYRENWGGWYSNELEAIKFFKENFEPKWQPPKKDFSEWHYLVMTKRSNPDAHFFEKPVIILMNQKCFSATDIFLSSFKGWRNITLLGIASAGGSARSVWTELPGSKLEVRLASMASFQIDGDLHDGNGTQPDIVVEPEPSYFIHNGRDNILEEALEILKKHKASK